MACHNFPVTTPIMAGDLFPIRTVIAFRSDESPQLCFFEILPSRFQRQRRSLIFGSHMDLWMERHNNLMFFYASKLSLYSLISEVNSKFSKGRNTGVRCYGDVSFSRVLSGSKGQTCSDLGSHDVLS